MSLEQQMAEVLLAWHRWDGQDVAELESLQERTEQALAAAAQTKGVYE